MDLRILKSSIQPIPQELSPTFANTGSEDDSTDIEDDDDEWTIVQQPWSDGFQWVTATHYCSKSVPPQPPQSKAGLPQSKAGLPQSKYALPTSARSYSLLADTEQLCQYIWYNSTGTTKPGPIQSSCFLPSL